MWQRRNWWVQFGIMLATIAGVVVAFWGYITWSQQVEYVGRVLDAQTLEPVVNADVTFAFAGALPGVYTDSRGVYRDKPPGTSPRRYAHIARKVPGVWTV